MKPSLHHMDQSLRCRSCDVARAGQSGHAAETSGLADGEGGGLRERTAPRQ